MKTINKTILILAIVIVMLPAVVMARAGKKGRSPQYGDKQGCEMGRFELTDEKIEYFMDRLQKADPEKARELEGLRKKDGEAFKAELRKTMRERFQERRKDKRGQRSDGRSRKYMEDCCQKGQTEAGKGFDKGYRDKKGQESRRGDRRKEGGKYSGKDYESYGQFGEHMRWMKKSCPKRLDEMVELSEKNPELFRQKMQYHSKRYGRIAKTEKSNPELAKALEDDLKLKDQRNKLLRQIRQASEDTEKQELTAQIKEVVGKRFDLIVKRKQIEYDQLSKKLERFKKRVERSESEVKKWQKAKDGKVKERVEELLERTEEFKWD